MLEIFRLSKVLANTMTNTLIDATLLAPIHEFLGCETPDSWVRTALENEHVMLVDHANCEKKAASTALSLIFRYTDRPELLMKMSKLAREELRHFEQVLQQLKKRELTFEHLSASRYAGELAKYIRANEPWKLIDKLIIGAYIEARSCERFAKLAPYLDADLQKFYESLLKSEARHFQDYLSLAQAYSDEDISPRVAEFQAIEAELVERTDTEFRFHSGPIKNGPIND